MKTKLFMTFFASMLIVFAFEVSAQVHVNVSVYARIPMAPDIVLNVSSERIAPPSPHYVWIDGYWVWDAPRRAYAWVDGYWAHPPYEGAYWLPGYWEKVNRGYVWINASWAPRNYRMHFGYYTGRYDYYGRPVYYHKPNHTHHHHAYVYSYDHRPEHRGKGHSSSAHYNSHVHDKKYKDNNRIHYSEKRNNAGGRDGKIVRDERKKIDSNSDKNKARVSSNNDNKQKRESSQPVVREKQTRERQSARTESRSGNVKNSKNDSSRERKNVR